MVLAILLGALGALLAASVGLNVFLLLARRSDRNFILDRERVALDRAAAAELRSQKQIDAMLDRVSTSPNMTLERGYPERDPEQRLYIPDTPDADETWNDYRGEPADEPVS